MKKEPMKINTKRLLANIDRFAQIGKKGRIGVERIALSDEDKKARDLLKSQMLEAGLEVHIDQLGNMIGIRKGIKDLPSVAMGSHLDTVYAGGRYDGALGVLAGLEVIQTFNDQNIQTEHPIALVNFTNEEGVRFAPDMMGSHVYAGLAELDEILAAKAYDNPEETIGSRLKAIGYDGDIKPGSIPFHCFFELHIEQGPVLEVDGIDIGVVEMVQGIHWTKYTVIGEANHAGTTPIAYRKDAGYAAAQIQAFVGDLSRQPNSQILTTVGSIQFEPSTINIVPAKASFTLDLRSVDGELLLKTQEIIDQKINSIVQQQGLTLEKEVMVRFKPVQFEAAMVSAVESSARELGLSTQRMPSGAGHDAQMMATFCPATMVFIPSVKGISHNVEEYSHDQDVENGANVLLKAVLGMAEA
jgi:beta-ureidopropionase / N-carbamoyl-L-amino-acid hydrolase